MATVATASPTHTKRDGLVSATAAEFQVILGSGHPSLESLCLTATGFFNETSVEELLAPLRKTFSKRDCGPLAPRWINQCHTVPYGAKDGINTCSGYLYALGMTTGTAQNTATTICTSSARAVSTTVEGVGIGPGSTSSYCRDASAGVCWVTNSRHTGCDGNLCYEADSVAVYRNGHLITHSWGNYW